MGENTSMSPADIAALQNGNMGEGSWVWFLLIFILLGWGGYGNRGNGGPAPMPVNVATQSDVNNAINNQSINSQLQQTLLSSANNNYETAQLVNGQTNALMQQNYANQINAIQGFNNVSNQIMNQTNQLSSKLDQLGFQMENCCCSIKTQMLQDRLADRDRQLLNTQNQLDNARQSQYILGTTGRYVAWAGSGTQTTGVVTAS